MPLDKELPAGATATPVPGKPDDYLHIWTVYKRPTDYPHGFVARLHLVGSGMHGPTNLAHYGATLDAVRAKLPNGLVCMQRNEADEAQIVETWL